MQGWKDRDNRAWEVFLASIEGQRPDAKLGRWSASAFHAYEAVDAFEVARQHEERKAAIIGEPQS